MGYSLSNCKPGALDKMTFLTLAELDCGQNADPSGPASAVYRLYGYGQALDGEFKAFIKDVSQTPCVDGGQTPMTWTQGQTSGQEACGTENGVATITWTTNGKNVLGSIRSSNTDINALRQWWLANA
ncbi:MAG TPA: serine/threonine protein kinase [Mycobacterium sp.]